ncbi:DUF4105 domain-containing protein [Gilvibacter sp.]|uniref:Lnb N-terminal periplasmic domain-containing protein n=1 Tax=Gilvibacter sp. TaxID=2729997 RepID=UPI0025C3281B|nr:DUF4105 domain-containing protein [Gilvibacter sp.]NQX77344.1 DUF4105 domain-containing protein [Gilvibacter sp.]
MRKLLLLLLTLITFQHQAQELQLSSGAEVSILTMGPGKALYDSFGHTAIRLEDKARGIDVIYNYGVYDFSDPNFYAKFAKGQMRYVLDRRRTEGFLRNYIEDNRWIKEQALALDQQEKQAMFIFLENNLKPENRAYNYDFFYDNCATKIPLILQDIVPEMSIDSSFVEEPQTFRTLIQQNVHWNTWGSFGMDLGIGSVVDRTAPIKDHMFLPEYVFKALEKASRGTGEEATALVASTKDLFENEPEERESNFLTSPLLVMLLLGLGLLFVTYRDSKKQGRTRAVDAVIQIFLGLVGVILLLLWFATDHYTTAYNYNLLWAFPLNLLLAFQLGKKHPKRWTKAYLKFLLLMLVLMSMHWMVGVQIFPKALIPFVIALAIRYVYLLKAVDKDLLPAVEDDGA